MEELDIMHKYGADYTNTFIALTFDKFEDTALFKSEEFYNGMLFGKPGLIGRKSRGIYLISL